MNESTPIIPFPGSQARSRDTADAILDAAEQLLREQGLDGCVIPEVARRAGRGVGSVYRRFGDKEGLLKAVLARYVSRAPQANAPGWSAIQRSACDLHGLVRLLVAGIIEGRRRDWRIIQALSESARSSADSTFQELGRTLREEALAEAAGILASRQGEIVRSDPAAAAHFAIGGAVNILDTHLQLDPAGATSKKMAERLVVLIIGYLTWRSPLDDEKKSRRTDRPAS